MTQRPVGGPRSTPQTFGDEPDDALAQAEAAYGAQAPRSQAPRGRRFADLTLEEQAEVLQWWQGGNPPASIEREFDLEPGTLEADLAYLNPEKPRVGQYADELAYLKELLDNGEISEEQYAERRRSLVGIKTTAAGGGGGRSYLPGEAERLERETALGERAQEFKERSARAQALIDEIEANVSAGRLSLDQAIAQFNRQLSTSRLAADIFSDLQQFSLPEGTEFIPGYEPGGVHEAIAKQGGFGFTPRRAQTTRVDPMAIAQRILSESDPAFQQAQAAAPQPDAVGEAYKRALAELGLA